MIVEIWSDIACPWCYVGKRRSSRRSPSSSTAIPSPWCGRSFELDPGAPPRHDEPQAVLLARKYGVPLAQAEAMNARMAGEAAKEGLAFRLDRVRVGNTFDAHRLLHLAATVGRREALVERLFAAYLGEGEALGEHDVLVRLATDVGLDAGEVATVLASDRFAADVRRDQARARGFGITGVPFFAIDERYGVSGAQATRRHSRDAPDALGRGPGPLTTFGSAAADGCDDGSCAT
jgi:predicted DsbA family dithiol-disulfide isomerase